MTPNASYRGAGVDIEAGDRAVEMMRGHVASTHRPEVIGDLGGFAGAFSASFANRKDPVLLGAADGVGTKLLIAQALDRHDTIGIDLVAMVVDDLVCHGGEPLFLLDYIACGRVVPERIERIVAGIAEGCRQAGCALLGGETAEHPGVMEPDAYDLAAFAVGVADRASMWGPDRVQEGDAVIGLASSGLHSNGYSLVRRIMLEHDLALDAPVPGLDRRALGDELLEPTRIYAPAMLALDREHGLAVRAAAHVTGGGIEGNLARVLPNGLEAVIDPVTWPVPAIFTFLAETGRIAEQDMRRAFNLGLGMTMVIAEGDAGRAVEALGERGLAAYLVGHVGRGERGVAREERST
ncbi:MAG TPA: phosphoribosylformylglycinamidine cyclo-ligase [Actinomycetota bacterium]|nr:phosphoribosylformylglycinamidine cyclo-ligase [Actinomycetota bacterium]